MVAYSFKRRFVTPIQVGLGIQQHIPGTEYVPKRQTIRALGKRRHARPGETLQLYTAMRTKQCMKISDALCARVRPIELWLGRGEELGVEIEGDYFCGSTRVCEFAQADGFAGTAEMVAFWRENHPHVDHFEGVLVEWESMP